MCVFTCSDENVGDIIILDVTVHPEAEEIHYAGEIVLISQPGQHLDVEVGRVDEAEE